MTSVPTFGPRVQVRDVVLLRGLPPMIAVACIAVAASGLVSVGEAALLAVIAALAAAHVVANAVGGSETRIIAALSGRVAEPMRDARLLNIVDGLCSAFGLRAPRVIVVDSKEPNAITFARRARHATLVVTSAALEDLDRIQLEALVAHELAHLRRGDVERASSIMRSLGYLARHSPRAAALCARLGGVDRESFADLAATSITRYPPALADTLELIDENRGEIASMLPRELVWLTSWQWCAPIERAGESWTTAVGMSLRERAQALREL
ncbi:MAG: M48 family metalloprotease [Acidimicrobiales bacterium]